MRRFLKLLGIAGLVGVAATGVVVARQRRAQNTYSPDEIRDRLHERLAETAAKAPTNGSTPAKAPTPG